MSFNIKELLKKLKPVKLLSETKLSKVYRMRHTQKDREYALKVVDENDKNCKGNIEKDTAYPVIPST